jgi:hypothetical protein
MKITRCVFNAKCSAIQCAVFMLCGLALAPALAQRSPNLLAPPISGIPGQGVGDPFIQPPSSQPPGIGLPSPGAGLNVGAPVGGGSNVSLPATPITPPPSGGAGVTVPVPVPVSAPTPIAPAAPPVVIQPVVPPSAAAPIPPNGVVGPVVPKPVEILHKNPTPGAGPIQEIITTIPPAAVVPIATAPVNTPVTTPQAITTSPAIVTPGSGLIDGVVTPGSGPVAAPQGAGFPESGGVASPRNTLGGSAPSSTRLQEILPSGNALQSSMRATTAAVSAANPKASDQQSSAPCVVVTFRPDSQRVATTLVDLTGDGLIVSAVPDMHVQQVFARAGYSSVDTSKPARWCIAQTAARELVQAQRSASAPLASVLVQTATGWQLMTQPQWAQHQAALAQATASSDLIQYQATAVAPRKNAPKSSKRVVAVRAATPAPASVKARPGVLTALTSVASKLK